MYEAKVNYALWEHFVPSDLVAMLSAGLYLLQISCVLIPYSAVAVDVDALPTPLIPLSLGISVTN